MKTAIIKRSLVIAMLASLSVAVPMAAKGESTTTGDSVKPTTTNTTETEKDTEDTSQAKTEVEKSKLAEARDARLDEIHKKQCQVRQDVIKLHGRNFTKVADRQLAVFDAIEARVKKFAEDKKRKPANYDALLADIATKRAVVVKDLDTLKTDAEAFKCDSANPKAEGQTLLADAKLVRSDLKTYRTSVRLLIQAVRNKPAEDSTKTENKQ